MSNLQQMTQTGPNSHRKANAPYTLHPEPRRAEDPLHDTPYPRAEHPLHVQTNHEPRHAEHTLHGTPYPRAEHPLHVQT